MTFEAQERIRQLEASELHQSKKKRKSLKTGTKKHYNVKFN